MGSRLDRINAKEKDEQESKGASSNAGSGSHKFTNTTAGLPKSRFTRKNRRGAAKKLNDFDMFEQTKPAPTGCDYAKLESMYKNKYDKQWLDEDADKLIPQGGFIQDFVAATRGLQASTLFAIWSSLYTLSAMAKRHAWISWGEDRVFPNLYVMFVARAGLFKKSTLIKYGDDVMVQACDCMENPVMRIIREPNTVRSEITPEALHDIMKPQRVRVKKEDLPPEIAATAEDEESDSMFIEGGSNVNLIVSELSTMLSKKKYNAGLVKKLLDLYDCPDTSDRTTRSDGTLTIENVYCTLFGGTTPDQLKNDFPDDALGSGFMSRTITVVQDKLVRRLSRPRHFEGAPDKAELAEKLGWIMDNGIGEYVFEPTAEAYIDIWYKEHIERLEQGDDLYSNIYSRFDLILRKVSVLARMQRYDKGRNITLEDVMFALKLLNYTYESSSATAEEVSSSPFFMMKKRVAETLSKYPSGMTRHQLYRSVQRYMNSEELQIALNELQGLGGIICFDEHMNVMDKPDKKMQMTVQLTKTVSELFPNVTQRTNETIDAARFNEEIQSDPEDSYETEAAIRKAYGLTPLSEIDALAESFYNDLAGGENARTREAGDG